MGAMPEAMLFYGFCIGDAMIADECLKDLLKWEDRYYSAIGIPKVERPSEYFDDQDPDVIAYWEYCQKTEDAKPPFEVEMYGDSCNFGIAIVVDKSVAMSFWTTPDYPDMKDYSHMNAQMEDFCEKAHIPYETPQWCLVLKNFDNVDGSTHVQEE